VAVSADSMDDFRRQALILPPPSTQMSISGCCVGHKPGCGSFFWHESGCSRFFGHEPGCGSFLWHEPICAEAGSCVCNESPITTSDLSCVSKCPTYLGKSVETDGRKSGTTGCPRRTSIVDPVSESPNLGTPTQSIRSWTSVDGTRNVLPKSFLPDCHITRSLHQRKQRPRTREGGIDMDSRTRRCDGIMT